jgi:prepilin peptidase CpaA
MLNLIAEYAYPAASLLCATMGAVYDVRSRRIPNFVTLPAIGFGLFLHLTLGGWRQMASAAAAGLICGLVFLAFFLAGGMGGGDVKLIAAAGCITGLPHIAYLLIFTSLAGGIMAVGLALYRHRLKNTLVNMWALIVHHKAEGLTPHPELNITNTHTLRLPYAIAIAAGSALSLCLLIAQG